LRRRLVDGMAPSVRTSRSAFQVFSLCNRNTSASRGPSRAVSPVVRLDETSKQLIAEARPAIPARPGQPARRDYEYERNGTANLFMMFAPLEGWRHVKVTDRHTALDYAAVLKELSDTHFPKADKIVLVQDNLNTRKPASLYEAYPAAEARRLVERFEWHYTPKHGSWLDMAECELSVRIPTQGGQVFRFDRGRHSNVIAATLPI
jgi:DDE superfamily endonuclease